MSVNKYKPHVYLIPEDDANRQLAVGFLNHQAVADIAVKVRTPAGGWTKVLDVFREEYVPLLRAYAEAHAILLIDFDGDPSRGSQFEQSIPNDVKSRVFVVGSGQEPETLRQELGMTFEEIGRTLAENCSTQNFGLWSHPHLIHNQAELDRMLHKLRPFLFE